MHPTYLRTIITGARTCRTSARGKLSAETMRRDDMCGYQVSSAIQDAATRRRRPRDRSPRTGYQFIAFVRRSDGGVYPRRVYTRPLQASETRSPLIGRPRCSPVANISVGTLLQSWPVPSFVVSSAVPTSVPLKRRRGNANRAYTFSLKLEWC